MVRSRPQTVLGHSNSETNRPLVRCTTSPPRPWASTSSWSRSLPSPSMHDGTARYQWCPHGGLAGDEVCRAPCCGSTALAFMPWCPGWPSTGRGQGTSSAAPTLLILLLPALAVECAVNIRVIYVESMRHVLVHQRFLLAVPKPFLLAANVAISAKGSSIAISTCG